MILSSLSKYPLLRLVLQDDFASRSSRIRKDYSFVSVGWETRIWSKGISKLISSLSFECYNLIVGSENNHRLKGKLLTTAMKWMSLSLSALQLILANTTFISGRWLFGKHWLSQQGAKASVVVMASIVQFIIETIALFVFLENLLLTQLNWFYGWKQRC